MNRLFFFLLSLCVLCLSPFSLASGLNTEQEKVLERQLAPIRAALDDMMTATDLLMKVRRGELSAEEVTPEVRRLLEQVADNRKLFEEQPVAEDAEVAKIVSLWMRWNHEKLATVTNVLIQFGNRYINTPGTLCYPPNLGHRANSAKLAQKTG